MLHVQGTFRWNFWFSEKPLVVGYAKKMETQSLSKEVSRLETVFEASASPAQPEARNPNPETRNPNPETRNPNPKRETRNPESQMLTTPPAPPTGADYAYEGAKRMFSDKNWKVHPCRSSLDPISHFFFPDQIIYTLRIFV